MPWLSCSRRPISVDFPSSTLPAVLKRSKPKAMLKVPLAFLLLHGAFLVVIDHTVFSLRPRRQPQLIDDVADRQCSGANRPRAMRAAERAHPAHHHLRLFAGEQRRVVLG